MGCTAKQDPLHAQTGPCGKCSMQHGRSDIKTANTHAQHLGQHGQLLQLVHSCTHAWQGQRSWGGRLQGGKGSRAYNLIKPRATQEPCRSHKVKWPCSSHLIWANSGSAFPDAALHPVLLDVPRGALLTYYKHACRSPQLLALNPLTPCRQRCAPWMCATRSCAPHAPLHVPLAAHLCPPAPWPQSRVLGFIGFNPNLKR
jgi:hypothetical protein